jgi:hypothetical protein
MAIEGKKLSELTDKVTDIQGTERIYVSDGSGTPKYIETSQLATSEQLQEKGDKVTTESATEDAKEIQPNRYYIFGEKQNLTITLAEGEEGKLNEYMFEFTSGTTPTTLTLPESVKWIGSNTIEASKTYQVSIVNNIAVLGGA